MRRMLLAAAALGLAATAPAAHAQQAPPEEAVRFPKGAFGTTVTGSVKGYASRVYTLGARRGQGVTLTLTSRNTLLCANLVTPSGQTLFNGSQSGPAFTGRLPEDGTYKVVVYFMRAEARRGTTAPYSLSLSIK